MDRSARQSARFAHAVGKHALGSDQLTLGKLDGESRRHASLGVEGRG
jgi:hypothetical protein